MRASVRCILFEIPFNIGVFFLPLVVLAKWQKSAKKIIKINKNPCVRACVRVTPPPMAFACNGDIFFSDIVSYMSYGASLWDSVLGGRGDIVYFPGGSTPIVLTDS